MALNNYLYLIFFKNNPWAGAGGAHSSLFLDLKTFLKNLKVHLSEDKYIKLPTIDLTWFCKNDLDLKIIVIDSPLILTWARFIFFIGLR